MHNFSDEQIEAAAKAMFEEEKGQTLNGEIWPNWEDLCRCNLNDRMCTHGGKQLPYVLLARAALVAAQGAAPRAVGERGDLYTCVDLGHEDCDGSHRDHRAPVLPSSTTPQAEAYDHCCQHPKCPGGSLCCCVSERRLRDCWNQWREEIAGDSKQAFRDGYQAGQNDPAPWLTAPVLPSSTVDEDKLARLLCEKNYISPDGRPTCAACRDKAHEVAEWLNASATRKEQGR